MSEGEMNDEMRCEYERRRVRQEWGEKVGESRVWREWEGRGGTKGGWFER